jgi:hypothetical protein
MGKGETTPCIPTQLKELKNRVHVSCKQITCSALLYYTDKIKLLNLLLMYTTSLISVFASQVELPSNDAQVGLSRSRGSNV